MSKSDNELKSKEIIKADPPSPPQVLRATHGSSDHPVRISNIDIPAYVLEDGTRVLSQRGLQSGIGMSISGGSSGAHRMARFIDTLCSKGLDLNSLAARIKNPILFLPRGGGRVSYGYEATILADICDAVLAARDTNLLNRQQLHIADQCALLIRGFARVGIIALVDEATGYQADRARDALEKILERFISAELVKWAKMFPDEFYQQMFRLRGWQYNPSSVKRPGIIGTYTNDLVYERLAPGVLDELKRITPKDDKGRRKHKYFQRLTEDIGHPRLREHLSAVIALMRAAANWASFYRFLQRALPKPGDTGVLIDEDDV